MKIGRSRIKNILVWTIILVLMTHILPMAAYADDYDAQKDGSITVKLNDLGTDAADVELACYQVGYLAEGKNVRYVLSEPFVKYDVDLNGLETAKDYREAAQKLAVAAASESADFRLQTTDGMGKVCFDKLEQGMYLILQKSTAAYGTIEPFLIAVPYTEDGQQWIYDVLTYTKGEKLPETEQTETEPNTDESGQTETEPNTDERGQTETEPNTGENRQTESVPATNERTDSKIVKTGDEFPVAALAFAFLVSGVLVMAVCFVYKKRKDK